MKSTNEITINPPQEIRALTTYQQKKKRTFYFLKKNTYRFLVCQFHAQAFLSVDLFFFRRAGINSLQDTFLKLYCTVQISLIDSASNLFLSTVHWPCMGEKILSTFPLCAGTAKQNCTNFKVWMTGSFITFTEIFCRFSWVRTSQTKNYFLNLFCIFLMMMKIIKNLLSSITPFKYTYRMASWKCYPWCRII